MRGFHPTELVCGLTLLATIGCSARQMLPEPAVQAVEPAQVTMESLGQTAEALQPSPEETAAPLFEIETSAAAEIVQTVATEPNPFAVIEQTVARQPNPFAPIEQTAGVQRAGEAVVVEHADHSVKEGCAGPQCELIGLEPVPVPGADRTNQPE